MGKRVIVGAVGIPLLFAVLFFLPLWVFALAIAAFTAIGAYEFLRCTAPGAPKRLYLITLIFAALIPLTSWIDRSSGRVCLLAGPFLLAVVLFAASVISMERCREKICLSQLLCAFFAGAVFPAMLSSLLRLYFFAPGRPYRFGVIQAGVAYVLLPVIITFACDSGAYFAGVLLGRHKLAPVVSPNKTIEGSVGGFVCGIGFTLLYGLVLSALRFDVNFWALALYGLAGSAFCELGDLSYSVIKREFGIKDYGKLLPGHGGSLDRFGSMSFVAPAIELLLFLYPAIVPMGAL